ncbi:UPF0158 family protein [Tengunoibacter tsumagoiensis]|uniref:Uncharacterized protein n=1 Tax=Tengunoibacter tsumagoiensis TaxID=2014871 RepID=A0A402AAY3_9CHLR|nr:UPF0158 family protein [Tengunoibacter tsumagoiensis]GCE16115.1 hypothetical protein KTT_59740 [Tengunoibacter tsumagoiensis]
MLTLPDGVPIDSDTLKIALGDSSGEHAYFLHTETGEVVFFSLYDDSEAKDELERRVNESAGYVKIEPVPSRVAYIWMEDFVSDVIFPENEGLATMLYRALKGKGAFGRFKRILCDESDRWLKEWYNWREVQMEQAMQDWITENISEESTLK